MSTGQFIVDTNNNIWLRWSVDWNSPINFYSAMCVWNNKLLLGGGWDGNINCLDWGYETEAIGNKEYPILSVWRSKNFDFGLPHIEKQLRKVVVVYRDDPGWVGKVITINYRINQETYTNYPQLPKWRALGSIQLGQAKGIRETRSIGIPLINLSPAGKYFQFEIRATGPIEISKMIIYFHILSEKE